MDVKKLALSRIKILIRNATDIFKEDRSLSRRYITLARKISTKTRTKMPREFKRLFCKGCNTIFIPTKTCRVRTTDGKVSYSCLNCGKITRFSFAKEQKVRRSQMSVRRIELRSLQ